MTGLGMMLKAFGVNVTEEHIQAVEVLIPELPSKLAHAWKTIDESLQHFDERLIALESVMKTNLETSNQLLAILEIQQQIAAQLEAMKKDAGSDRISKPGPKRVNGRTGNDSH